MIISWKNITSLFFLVLFLLSCTKTSSEQASQLYIEANQIMQETKIETDNYEIFDNYKKAARNIEIILNEYSSSNIAIALINDELKIANLSLDEFKKFEQSIIYLGEIERDIFSSALLMADYIDNLEDKVEVLKMISLNLIGIHEYDKASQVLSEAIKINTQIEDNYSKLSNFIEIARQYIKINEVDPANEILTVSLDQIELEDNLSSMIRKYTLIGEAYYWLSDNEKSNEVIDFALNLIDRLQHQALRDMALQRIGIIFAKTENFPQAIITIDKIEDASIKSITLSELADLHLEISEISNAYEISKMIQDPFYKGKTLINISHEVIENGNKDLASEKVYEAFLIAQAIDDKFNKSSLLGEIALTYYELENTNSAIQILSNAFVSLNRNTNQFSENSYNNFRKSAVISDLAIKHFEMGNKVEAISILSQAHEKALSIEKVTPNQSLPRANYRSSGLRAVCISYAKIGENEKALELASSMDLNSNVLIELSKIFSDQQQYHEALEAVLNIEDIKSKTIALSEIASRFHSKENILKEEQLALLREIIQSVNPLAEFFTRN